jgi:hypothetical protein
MKNLVINAFHFIVVLAAIDVIVLLFSLAQIATEGRTGEWSPFWATQAKVLLSILN